MNPALWAVITRDLDAATRYAETAVQRAASLESYSEDMDDDIREDRQAAIGLLLGHRRPRRGQVNRRSLTSLSGVIGHAR